MNIEEYAYCNFVKKDDVVYDIGAHVGSVSVRFAKIGVKKVYAFEPSVTNFIDLKKNTSSFTNIECYNLALNDHEYSCKTKFKDCRTDRERDSEQDISYVVLEDLIKKERIELPDFVKMDIEGMESIVLKTFDFLFKQKRPIVFVELHVAPKNEPQRYKDNPHWATPEDGGFDFNTLKQHDYIIIDRSLIAYPELVDWNPTPILHKGVILIPKEKA